MRCPYCATDHDRVVDSRPADDGEAVRRRRECRACGLRFSTVERTEHPALTVRKRSGQTEPYDADKVAAGIRKATKNRDFDADTIRRAVAGVEARVRSLSRREVDAEAIGGAVLETLRGLDHVSYLRFASVYKGFTSTGDFARELAELEAAGEAGPGATSAGRAEETEPTRAGAEGDADGSQVEPDAG